MKSILSNDRQRCSLAIAFSVAILAATFAAQASDLFVTNFQANKVGKYDAATGVAVNDSFVSVSMPLGIAVSGSTVYVSSLDAGFNGSVFAFDATTGAAAAGFTTIAGPNAGSLAISGNILYIPDGNSGSVGTYNAASGARINQGLVTDLTNPVGVAVGDNVLYVVDDAEGRVYAYTASTGSPLSGFTTINATDPKGVAVAGSILYVVFSTGKVSTYNSATGALITNNFIANAGTQVNGIAVAGNVLYAPRTFGTIGTYNATSGAAIAANLVSGLTTPWSVAILVTAAAPSISSPASSAITASSATLGATVDSDGGATITARGVVYAATATNANPQLNGVGVTNATSAGTTGAFTVNVSGLTAETGYSFAAYAINSVGTTYTTPVSTFTTASLAPTITGAVANQPVNDDATLAPFTGVTIADPVTANIQTVTVSLDAAAKGAFTAESLTASGFASAGAGTYTFSGNAASATSAIRLLVFRPSANRVAVGSTETTTLTIATNNGAGGTASNAITTVVSTSINDAPTLTLPVSPFLAEATGPNGAAVTFQISAQDFEDNPAPVANATPASGSVFALGDTTVQVSVTDSNNATVTGSFVVRVQDTTKPVLTLPANITAEATSPAGAVVTFVVGATDLVDGTLTPVLDHLSGETFPIGTTTVNVSATDAALNTQSGSFTITVEDTTKPVLNLPGNITAEATSAAGAVVTFAVTATDAAGGTLTPALDHLSGETFPIGTTTINVSATDAALNTQTGSFTVTVVDTTKPALNLPGNITAEATSAAGAVVTFAVTVTDLVDGTLTPVLDHLSGETFPIGTTVVNVSTIDAALNAQTGSFTITVADTTKPVLNVPADLTVDPASAAGAVVIFSVSATDIVDGVLVPTVVPASGNLFPIGTTTVSASATDAAGNVQTATFTVTVKTPGPGLAGAGVDSDGDGFSDSLETAAQTDPNSNSSTPTGGVLTPGAILPLEVRAASIKLNFAKASKDTITVGARWHYPATAGDVTLIDRIALVDVGGVISKFTLTKKRVTGTGNATFAVGAANRRNKTADFTVTFKSGAYQQTLENNAGLTDTVALNKAEREIKVTVILDNAVLQQTVPLLYSAKPGKSGMAKKRPAAR